jgi:hypothetical protein
MVFAPEKATDLARMKRFVTLKELGETLESRDINALKKLPRMRPDSSTMIDVRMMPNETIDLGELRGSLRQWSAVEGCDIRLWLARKKSGL